ncbi:MAG TPA: phosphoglucosamine mutase [Pyrinomonadaceae bacterium]|nr:phosphoglucosamine mutase [Pyrinomonadaceae bacterium]
MTNKKTKLFGTDGIRAKAGEFPLDSKTVRTIGASLARHLAERTTGRTPVIVTGRDTRESGPRIEEDLMAGAVASGASVQSAGVITTPGVAYLARVLPADAGVVISASHNPFADNGIKIFDPSGRKLDDATERQIESDIAKGELGMHEAGDAARATNEQNAINLRDRYLDYLEHEIGGDLSLTDLRIVVDCANGAASEIAPKLLSDLGARVIPINNEPNGRNINLNCGSLHIEALQQRVLAERADVGVAFDGDADRALFVDAQGNFVDGDATMWVLASYLKGRGELNGDTVVATVMTNLGLEVALRERGIRLSRTDVGDKYVLDELLRSKASLGGEQSGHIIFPGVSLAGDGMITALSLLRVMKDEGKSLAELTRGFVRYPQILVNVRVREKVPFESVPAIANKTQQVQRELGDRGRLLLRYSGTEALARVMIEGEDEAHVRTSASLLAEVIRAEIGA